MLEDFSFDQRIVYKIISNSISKGKYSHAYLIESNGYSKSLEFAISFAKTLLCPFNYLNRLNCQDCNQCRLIDDNNFIELKIIKPEGEWIKKDQLDELQSLFSKKAIIGNKKIYIIDGVERLNVISGNSILKFLEEPSEGIIAILITENLNNVLNTIISRCQILSLRNTVNDSFEDKSVAFKLARKIFNSESKIENFIMEDSTDSIVQKVINFVNYFEQYKLQTLLYIDSLWNSYFSDRKRLMIAFEIMLYFYNDILNYIMNNPIEIFNDYKKDIQSISIKSNKYVIAKKMKIIVDLKEKIKYNININLLMDKLLIMFKECDNDV